MIFSILTIAAHSLVMFAMRFTEANSGNRYAATVATYVVGAVIAFFMMDEYTLIRTEPGAVYTLLMAAYNGVCMTMGMILCRLSMGKNGTPISTTFNRLGVLIPTVFSILLFGETSDRADHGHSPCRFSNHLHKFRQGNKESEPYKIDEASHSHLFGRGAYRSQYQDL